MKKVRFRSLTLALLLGALTVEMSSCATVFGGRITDSQRRKPLPGEPSRKVRVVPLIADLVLFWPGLIVDFATSAIYKPDRAADTKPGAAATQPGPKSK